MSIGRLHAPMPAAHEVKAVPGRSIGAMLSGQRQPDAVVDLLLQNALFRPKHLTEDS